MNSKITIKSLNLGTYVLVGKYTWVDFHMSKYSPTRIPTRSSDIFIPKITENYDQLLAGIRGKKKIA